MIKIGIEHMPLQWRHNGHDNVSNHQPHDCLLNRLFRRRSKKTSKLRVTGLCAGNSPGAGEFPSQMASYAENVSMFPHKASDAELWWFRWSASEQAVKNTIETPVIWDTIALIVTSS